MTVPNNISGSITDYASSLGNGCHYADVSPNTTGIPVTYGFAIILVSNKDMKIIIFNKFGNEIYAKTKAEYNSDWTTWGKVTIV